MAGEMLTWFTPPSPASDDQIAAMEAEIGFCLPDDYRQFARKYAGGSPVETDFEFKDVDCGVFCAALGEFLTLCPNHESYLVRWMKETEFFPPGLVPFGIDGGGNCICFDIRHDRSHPAIVFWHSGRDTNTAVSFVAASFSDFIGLLHEPDPDEA